jgi:DNA-binding transcriptional LysR family regulator
MVEADLREGTLVRIDLETSPNVGPGFFMNAVYRKERPPGPAGRWCIARLKDGAK